MRKTRILTLLTLVSVVLGMASCGLDQEYLVAIQISPAAGTATTAGSSNTVQFTAIGWYATVDCNGQYGCIQNKPNKHQILTNANWSSDDPANTSISSSGLAICASPTSTPATITAKASGGYNGSITGSGTLICN